MILNHLIDTLILTLWMSVITFAFKGWGGLIRRWINQPDNTDVSIWANAISDIWIGICICISLTELIHFAHPINWKISVTILGIGLALDLQRHRSGYAKLLAGKSLKCSISTENKLYITAFCAISFVWMAAAMLTPNIYDSGLYHFTSIKWLNEHPTIFGLVNLHSRLAFNQSYFALIALINFSPFYQQAHAGTGVYLFILTAVSCFYWLPSHAPKRWLLLACVFILLNGFVLKTSSPTPDLAVALMQTTIFFLLVKSTLHQMNSINGNDQHEADQNNLLALAIICTSAVTIKLTMFMFCFGALIMMWRPLKSWFKINRSNVLRLLIVCAAIMTIHSLRGIALSGMPFYPSTFAGIWRLPYAPDISVPISETKWIYSWARQPVLTPEVVMQSWEWIGPWVKAQSYSFWALSITSLALMTTNILLLFTTTVARTHIGIYRLYIPLVLSAGFWFFSAPDPRFLGGVLQLSVSLGVWLMYLNCKSQFVRLNLHPSLSTLLIVAGFISITALTTLHLSDNPISNDEQRLVNVSIDLHRINIDVLATIIGLAICLYWAYLNRQRNRKHDECPPSMLRDKSRNLSRLMFRVAASLVVIGLFVLALLYGLNLKTGLGLAQYLYINDLLFALSQANINTTFFLLVVSGSVVVWLQRNSTWLQCISGRYVIVTDVLSVIIIILLLGFIIQFLATFTPLNITKLRGWHSVPLAEYEEVPLDNNLTINVTLTKDQCWDAPLPCTHTINRNLRMEQLSIVKGAPPIHLFTVRP